MSIETIFNIHEYFLIDIWIDTSIVVSIMTRIIFIETVFKCSYSNALNIFLVGTQYMLFFHQYRCYIDLDNIISIETNIFSFF